MPTSSQGARASPDGPRHVTQSTVNADVKRAESLQKKAGDFAALHRPKSHPARPPPRPESPDFDTRLLKINPTDLKNAHAVFSRDGDGALSPKGKAAVFLPPPDVRSTTAEAVKLSAWTALDVAQPKPGTPGAASISLTGIPAGTKRIGSGHGTRGWDTYSIASAPLVPVGVVHAPETPAARAATEGLEGTRGVATGYPTGGLPSSRPGSALQGRAASAGRRSAPSSRGSSVGGSGSGVRGVSRERAYEVSSRGSGVDFRDGHVASAIANQETAAVSTERQRSLLSSRGLPVSQPLALPLSRLSGPVSVQLAGVHVPGPFLTHAPQSTSPIRRADEYGNTTRHGLDPSLRPVWVMHTSGAESNRIFSRPSGDLPVDPRQSAAFTTAAGPHAVGHTNPAILSAAATLQGTPFLAADSAPVRVRVWSGGAEEAAKAAHNLKTAEAGVGGGGRLHGALETQRGRAGARGSLASRLGSDPDSASVSDAIGRDKGALILDDPLFNTHVAAVALGQGLSATGLHAGTGRIIDGAVAALTGQLLPFHQTGALVRGSQLVGHAAVGSAFNSLSSTSLLEVGPHAPAPPRALPHSFSARAVTGAPSVGSILRDLLQEGEVRVGDTGSALPGEPSLGDVGEGTLKAPFMQPVTYDKHSVVRGGGTARRRVTESEDHDRYPEAAAFLTVEGGNTWTAHPTAGGNGLAMTSTAGLALDPDESRRLVDSMLAASHPFYAKARSRAHAVEVSARTAGLDNAVVIVTRAGGGHDAFASSIRPTSAARAVSSSRHGTSRGAIGTVLLQDSALRVSADPRTLRATLRSAGQTMALGSGAVAHSALLGALAGPASRPASHPSPSSQLASTLATSTGTRPGSGTLASSRVSGTRTLRTSASQGQGISWALGSTGPDGSSAHEGVGDVGTVGDAARAHAWAAYMAKSLAPTTPLLKLGALHAGVEYAYPLRLRNHTAFTRRFRVAACGLSDAPSCPRGSLRVRFRNLPLAPGLSVVLSILVRGLEPGVLTGSITLTTDDGESIHVVLGGYALSPSAFREARDWARAGQGLAVLRTHTDRLEVNAAQWDAAYVATPLPGGHARLKDGGAAPLTYAAGGGALLEASLGGGGALHPALGGSLGRDAPPAGYYGKRPATGDTLMGTNALAAAARGGGPDFLLSGLPPHASGVVPPLAHGLPGGELYMAYQTLGGGAGGGAGRGSAGEPAVGLGEGLEQSARASRMGMSGKGGGGRGVTGSTTRREPAVSAGGDGTEPSPSGRVSPFNRGMGQGAANAQPRKPGPGGAAGLTDDRWAMGVSVDGSGARSRGVVPGGGSPVDHDWAALLVSQAETERDVGVHAAALAASSRGVGGVGRGVDEEDNTPGSLTYRPTPPEEEEEEEGGSPGVTLHVTHEGEGATAYPYEDLDGRGNAGVYTYLDVGGEGYPSSDVEGVPARASPTSTLLRLSLAHATTPGDILAAALARGLPPQFDEEGAVAGGPQATAAEEAVRAAFARRGPDAVIGGRAVYSVKLEGVALYPEHTPSIAAAAAGVQRGEDADRAANSSVVGVGGRRAVHAHEEEEKEDPGSALARSLHPLLGARGVSPADVASTEARDYVVPAGGTHPLLVPMV